MMTKKSTTKKRIKRIRQKYEDYEMYMTFNALSYVDKVPECVEKLKSRDDENLWKTAMEWEI